MKKARVFILQGLFCFFALSLCWIHYLEKQNELTELRLYGPRLALEIKGIQEENTRLKYQLQEFESPGNLMQMLGDSRFSYLKHPVSKDILVLQEEKEFFLVEPKQTFVAGAP